MAGATFNLAVQFEMTQIDCGECGGSYFINEVYRKQKSTNGGYWNCPYCQCSWGYGKSEIAKAREALEAEKARHLSTLGRLNEEAAARAKVERTLKRTNKRIQAGVCTCCNRTFVNLARHMATKHPEGT